MSKVPAIYQLGHLPIKDHVFSPDRSILAITKGNDVEVYQISPSNLLSKPQLIAVLKIMIKLSPQLIFHQMDQNFNLFSR